MLGIPGPEIRTRALLTALVLSLLAWGCASPLAAQWAPSGKTLDLSRTPLRAEIVCEGTEKMTLEARVLEVEGAGILAQGSCVLELIDVEVVSRAGIALVIRDQAKVTIRGGRFEGPEAAMALDGSATVDTGESEFWGGIGLSGSTNLSFTESSANGFWQKTPAAIAADG